MVSLKNATSESWLLTSPMSPCKQTDGKFAAGITACNHTSDGSFGGANASIVSIMYFKSGNANLRKVNLT